MNQSSNLAVNTLLTDQVRQVAGTAGEPIDAWLEAHRQELVSVRRHLHMHPEPSGRERETTSYLAQRLDEAGVTATVLRDGLGLVADAVIGDPGPDAARVALRADIDALKIQDAKSVEYRSRCDGVMHACGHDVHSSIVMGIARAVAGQAGRTPLEPGCGMHLRYLFQPAEEICLGARWLVEQGVLEGVDAILGLHVDPENPAGQFGVRYGPLTAAPGSPRPKSATLSAAAPAVIHSSTPAAAHRAAPPAVGAPPGNASPTTSKHYFSPDKTDPWKNVA